ncbi:MAG: RNA-binding transcriptional accessory protein [Clostridia bacterium]|nr:RNA-binding transcriptional accessory protein [Clostridia bacterium]
MTINERLAAELNIKLTQTDAAVELLDAGNTVPFISRYRKEVTGGLDDDVLRKLSERLTYLRNLEEKREDTRKLIDAQGKLTEEIASALDAAQTVTEIDDIYRPFRPKRRTRASVAREKGLADLAAILMEQKLRGDTSVTEAALPFVNEELGVADTDAAIAGACDIIAEDISDNAEFRKVIRAMTRQRGSIESKKIADGATYEQYYEYSEPLSKIPPHRVLALNRAEKEGVLKVSIIAPRDNVISYLEGEIVKDSTSSSAPLLKATVCDSYDRLIAASVEREIRGELFDNACESAIGLFSKNLRGLLMQAPLKGKTVLGYDPGYRTGCKLAVITPTGSVVDTAVIYPTKPHERIAESKKIVERLIRKWGVDVVAIGNGTASGESEMFIAELLSELKCDTKYIIVSEAGASVYSASKQGAEEFPDFDVTQRSAVSIARRLQDPLAELVKIDPKSIGVGQYQHDMKEARLNEALGGVVESCVNSVGVDLNTASYSLLSYIAGINITSAKNIVKYRDKNGAFLTRAEVLKVPRFGAKAYEQAAGFLRVPDSDEVLDNTGVHPESYETARALLKKFGFTEADVRDGKLTGLADSVKKIGAKSLAEELGCGVPTLNDIVGELMKPGRDVRDSLPPPELKERVLSIDELTEGMELSGVVRNVIDFGAFVDIGVHQDGLVHISEISDKYIKHPSEVLSVGMAVKVRVKSIDRARGRIGLTMKKK